jgi:hypothetical protein
MRPFVGNSTLLFKNTQPIGVGTLVGVLGELNFGWARVWLGLSFAWGERIEVLAR